MNYESTDSEADQQDSDEDVQIDPTALLAGISGKRHGNEDSEEES